MIMTAQSKINAYSAASGLVVMPSSCARFPYHGHAGIGKAGGRSSPPNRVCNNFYYVLIVVALAGLVTGLKIKYFSESALKGHACAQENDRSQTNRRKSPHRDDRYRMARNISPRSADGYTAGYPLLSDVMAAASRAPRSPRCPSSSSRSSRQGDQKGVFAPCDECSAINPIPSRRTRFIIFSHKSSGTMS